MALLLAVSGTAQRSGEYLLKAVFLYNFVKSVEWPAATPDSAAGSVTVCILGNDPFESALGSLRGRTVNGKKLWIRTIGSVAEANSCSVVFISDSESARVEQILGGLKGASVLTVGDTPGTAKRGCVIDFVMEDNKVRYEINARAADAAHLKISPNLLGLAKTVWQ
jgi:hypothetical protein